MKHDHRVIAHAANAGLPDAPLAMPKQELERPRRLFDFLRQAFFGLSLF